MAVLAVTLPEVPFELFLEPALSPAFSSTFAEEPELLDAEPLAAVPPLTVALPLASAVTPGTRLHR